MLACEDITRGDDLSHDARAPRSAGHRLRGGAAAARREPAAHGRAGFVGFAARGPVDVPVLVEDPARSATSSAPTRCSPGPRTARRARPPRPGGRGVLRQRRPAGWVVRVAKTGAGGAVTNRFAVPGSRAGGHDEPGLAAGVACRARSPGAWSDGLTAGATLERTTTSSVDGRSRRRGGRPRRRRRRRRPAFGSCSVTAAACACGDGGRRRTADGRKAVTSTRRRRHGSIDDGLPAPPARTAHRDRASARRGR